MVWAYPTIEIILIFDLPGNEEGQKGMVDRVLTMGFSNKNLLLSFYKSGDFIKPKEPIGRSILV